MADTTTVMENEQGEEIPVAPREKEWSPIILGILCNWCSYAGADLAGSSRIKYPPNIRIVRVPCSGRVNPMYILKGFQKGFDGVVVLGCHPGDCHYAEGNYYARRRIMLLKEFLKFLGIPKERFHFEWVSASEGSRFAEVVKEMTEKLEALGPFEGVVGEKRQNRLIKAIKNDKGSSE